MGKEDGHLNTIHTEFINTNAEYWNKMAVLGFRASLLYLNYMSAWFPSEKQAPRYTKTENVIYPAKFSGK